MIKLNMVLLFCLFQLKTFAQQYKPETLNYIKPLFDFDPLRAALVKNAKYSNPDLLCRSVLLTGYREGVEKVPGFANFSSRIDHRTGLIRIYMYNLTIEEMLTHGMTPSSEVDLQVEHPEKYRYVNAYGNKTEWLRNNAWCLEITLPAGKSSTEFVDAQLSSLFGVRFGFKKKMTTVLVLVRTSKNDGMKSKLNSQGTYDQHGHYNGMGLQALAALIQQVGLPEMIDETGYKGLVDMDLNVSSSSDLPKIRKALQKYGLDLREETREVEKFEITQIQKNEN